MIEDNFGVIFACAPAIRQLYAYHRRTGTILPGKDRQRPNEDFKKMRRKINFRDIFWYRQAVLTEGRVRDAHPIFQHQANSDTECLAAPEYPPNDVPPECLLSDIPPESLPDAPPPVTQKSVMDWWEDRIKKFFCGGLSASQSSDDRGAKPQRQNLCTRFFTSQQASNLETSVIASDQDLLKSPTSNHVESNSAKDPSESERSDSLR